MRYTAQFLARYAGIEPSKPTEPPADAIRDGFVGFVGTYPASFGIIPAEQNDDERVKAMLQRVGEEPDLWRRLECELHERAGILQYDAGLSRTEAESQAEVMTYESWLN
jgi:hypothetical protein